MPNYVELGFNGDLSMAEIISAVKGETPAEENEAEKEGE